MNSAPAQHTLTAPTYPERLPAGGLEPFAAAPSLRVTHRCGMGEFNARRKADNFTDDTLRQLAVWRICRHACVRHG